jgi:hypothetical protein
MLSAVRSASHMVYEVFQSALKGIKWASRFCSYKIAGSFFVVAAGLFERATSDERWQDLFIFSRVVLVISVVVCIGAWLNSSFLKSKSPDAGSRQMRKHATPADWKRFRRWAWVPVVGILAGLVACLVWAASVQMSVELSRLHGRLIRHMNPRPPTGVGELSRKIL